MRSVAALALSAGPAAAIALAIAAASTTAPLVCFLVIRLPFGILVQCNHRPGRLRPLPFQLLAPTPNRPHERRGSGRASIFRAPQLTQYPPFVGTPG